MKTFLKKLYYFGGHPIVIVLALIIIVALIFFKSSSPIKGNYTLLSEVDNPVSYSSLYLPEENYSHAMETIVKPALEPIQAQGTFTSTDNAEIAYQRYTVDNPVGTIVMSHGFSETHLKYSEVIYYFTSNHYNVYIPDHRGHGFSGRQAEDPFMVHIDDFQDYVDDFKQLIDTIVIPENPNSPLYIFAHSMGGAIATLYLEQNPGIITAAILSAPMLEPHLGKVSSSTGNIISSIASLIGKGKSYIFSHGPYTYNPESVPTTTTSLPKYRYYYEQIANTKACQMGGGSFGWLKESLEASKKAVQDASLLEGIPILMFQAQNDTYVKPEAQYEVANEVSSVKLIHVENASHELYLETDSIFYPYFDTVLNFYQAHR